MLAHRTKAEYKYRSYRREVHKRVEEALPYGDADNIFLQDIDTRALIQAKLWSLMPTRKVDFNWESDWNIYKRRYPKRFELAIWYTDKLESLALGRPSANGSRLRLELIERVAENSFLKGRAFAIIELSVIAYAELLGADEVRIMQPINKEVRDYYIRHGYDYVPSTGAEHFPDYCVKRL